MDRELKRQPKPTVIADSGEWQCKNRDCEYRGYPVFDIEKTVPPSFTVVRMCHGDPHVVSRGVDPAVAGPAQRLP